MKFGVGQSVRRTEDPRLVTGAGAFTDDVNLEGQLYVAFYRSPHAHARLRAIHLDEARASADGVVVYTAPDLASLGEEYESGADELEQEGDGGGAGDRELKDNLWVRGLLDANRGGDLVVLATLTDLDGNTISQAGSLYSLESAASEVGFQLD